MTRPESRGAARTLVGARAARTSSGRASVRSVRTMSTRAPAASMRRALPPASASASNSVTACPRAARAPAAARPAKPAPTTATCSAADSGSCLPFSGVPIARSRAGNAPERAEPRGHPGNRAVAAKRRGSPARVLVVGSHRRPAGHDDTTLGCRFHQPGKAALTPKPLPTGADQGNGWLGPCGWSASLIPDLADVEACGQALARSHHFLHTLAESRASSPLIQSTASSRRPPPQRR